MLSACEGDPGSALALGAQAELQLEANQIAAARQTIVAAIQERDDLPSLYLIRGRIELATNRTGAAYEAYATALSLEATNPEALQGVAQLGLPTGHPREAEDAADRILSIQPEQPEALLVKGLIALLRNRPKPAIEIADRILAVSPTNEGGAILKARALYISGEDKQALAFLEGFGSAASESEGLARTRLELFREAGDASSMLGQFAVLARFAPKDWNLKLDEINLRYKTGDGVGARKLWRDALFTLSPDREQTAALAALWREYESQPLSLDDRDRLRAETNENAREEVARYYLDGGEPRKALALVAGKPSMRARSLAARAQVAMGNSSAGARAADRILERDATQCDALLARSAARLTAGEPRQAIVAAQLAAAECPDDVAAPIALARSYAKERNPAGVLRSYVEGIDRNPQNPSISKAFLSWLKSQGAIREAIAEGRRLTRKVPALNSSWQGYLAICNRYPEFDCSGEARAGLDRARRSFGIDLPPGEITSRSLFGRLPPR